MKKSFAFGLFLASSLLVACGGTNQSVSSTPSSKEPTASSATTPSKEASSKQEAEATVAYQITASYDQLYDAFASVEFYGLMYSDNTGVLYKAMLQNSGEKKNIPQVDDEPVSFRYRLIDDDGIESLQAAIGGTKFTGTKNKDGNFILKNYKFPFAGGYYRSVDLIVSKTITYQTEEAWEAGLTEAYKDRTITVVVNDTFKGPVFYADGEHQGERFEISFGESGTYGAEAKFVLNSDFSLEASYGVGGSYGGASYEGTWTVDDDLVYVLTLGETEIHGEKVDGHEKFVWNFAHQAVDGEGNPVGDPINLTATLEWVDPSAQA